MKKIILALLFTGFCSFVKAQVPDSTRRMKTSPEKYRTDSVKNGKEMYNDNKSRKSKSDGDTLATPKKVEKLKVKS